MVDSDGNNEAAILFNSHATAQMPSNTVFQSLPAVYREYDFITRAVWPSKLSYKLEESQEIVTVVNFPLHHVVYTYGLHWFIGSF